MFSEAEFQAMILALAKMMGMITYHTHDSRRSDPGFPDLVIVGAKGVLYRELKTDKGRVSPEQEAWLAALVEAGQDARVWRPSLDWPDNVSSELRALGRPRIVIPVKKGSLQIPRQRR